MSAAKCHLKSFGIPHIHNDTVTAVQFNLDSITLWTKSGLLLKTVKHKDFILLNHYQVLHYSF